MQVWRISKRIYADSSFSGKGGLYAPARWNHRGHLIVYTAQSLSLAAWETFVHAAPEKTPLTTYVSACAEIPDDIPVHSIDENMLPPNWNNAPSPIALRDIGTQWLLSCATAVARVPSAVTRGEFNYLLNPSHPDFQRITPGEPTPFVFDPRAWKQVDGPVKEGAREKLASDQR